MSEQDAGIEWLKAGVSCAALLERLPPVWQLDRAESTRHSLKYRRGTGEILIVNHDGRGWWDPLSDRKGDIFTLVQHLDPGLSFGAARRMLCHFVGIVPAFPTPSARGAGERPLLFPPPSYGVGACPCRTDHRPGATSPGSEDYRKASWWPRAWRTPSGKALAAAPGSRIGTALDC
jgi:hypothetical protein